MLTAILNDCASNTGVVGSSPTRSSCEDGSSDGRALKIEKGILI